MRLSMDVYFTLPIDLYDSLGSDDGDEENYTKVYLASEVDARIADLESALREAIESVEDWSGYASDYFREKHDLEGKLKRLKSVL